ncbi:unnamed protein product [Rhizoctonia solani]|uniref:Peptidase C14 caspase domain-containing protein n=1 Tax=Rhizoctonia solani TaxID=456999 RepID=A0A8H3APT5_9AGAM|nr:unnamed protein product [Rhizoctonia solani]
MFWPTDRVLMELKGTIKDREHIGQFLNRFVPGIRVMGLKSGGLNALRDDIVHAMDEAVRIGPPLVVVYFQGHGEGHYGPLRYITGDRKEGGKLEGFTAEGLVKMFSKLSAQTMAMVITDFCNTGNIYRLRFILVPRSDGSSFWAETQEWEDDQKSSRVHSITSPMIHAAGSLECQSVYETEKRGGYLTNSLANLEAGPLTLARFLLNLRRDVEVHLQDAKAHPRSPLPEYAEQVPQVYCNFELPPNDPESFLRIYDGTAKSFYSTFN